MTMRNAVPDELMAAIATRDPISGNTHNFYRYPARFSPLFVREVIRHFSKPGDVVLDPFMGGGTAIVEAIALGRRSIGVDLNTLAHFVATVKTTQLPRYLASMEAAGFVESDALTISEDNRVWRKVPNRKWYCHNGKEQDSAKEVVLFHRPA